MRSPTVKDCFLESTKAVLEASRCMNMTCLKIAILAVFFVVFTALTALASQSFQQGLYTYTYIYIYIYTFTWSHKKAT